MAATGGFHRSLDGRGKQARFQWELEVVNIDPAQIVILGQNETDLRVFQFVNDRLGMVRGA